MDDAELTEIKQVARNNRMTVAEWARQALRTAREPQPPVTADETFIRVLRLGRTFIHGLITAPDNATNRLALSNDRVANLQFECIITTE